MYIILSTLGTPTGSSSSTLSTAHAGPNPHSHQNNSIYCRGRSLLMICSFIPIIFNNHPHLFVKLVHLLSFSPYTTPEKWAYHLPSPSTPNSPGKIAFFLSAHFLPLSYIPHEKWGYQNPLASTQNFPRNIGFREGKRAIYRTINGIGWMITTPPIYSWKCDWKFRVDIQWKKAARKDRFIKVSKAHEQQYVVSFTSF